MTGVGKVTVCSMGDRGDGSAGYTVPFTLFRIRLSSLEVVMAKLDMLFIWKQLFMEKTAPSQNSF